MAPVTESSTISHGIVKSGATQGAATGSNGAAPVSARAARNRIMSGEYRRDFPDMDILLMQLKIVTGFRIAYPERGFNGRGT